MTSTPPFVAPRRAEPRWCWFYPAPPSCRISPGSSSWRTRTACAGPHLPASSMTDGFASPIIRPERALRGFALGRHSWLFAGSERGADRAAAIATLIMTAKLNEVDPQAWLADVLGRINAHPARALDDLLPWNWRAAQADLTAAA